MISDRRRKEIARQWNYFSNLVRQGESAPRIELGGSVMVSSGSENSEEHKDFDNLVMKNLEKLLNYVPSTDSFKDHLKDLFKNLYQNGLLKLSLSALEENLGIGSDLRGFDSRKIQKVEYVMLFTLLQTPTYRINIPLTREWKE